MKSGACELGAFTDRVGLLLKNQLQMASANKLPFWTTSLMLPRSRAFAISLSSFSRGIATRRGSAPHENSKARRKHDPQAESYGFKHRVVRPNWMDAIWSATLVIKR
jgi:hypothetical protein